MGNLFASCAVRVSKEDEMLQVMKVNDGKILEFRTHMKVKDLLINYPNFYVGLFKEATQPLPLEYKLKLGKIYCLLPCFNVTILEPTNVEYVSSSSDHIPKPKNGVVRIKIIITKQQLRQILSNQMRVETMLSGFSKESFSHVGLLSTRLHRLQPVAEESE